MTRRVHLVIDSATRRSVVAVRVDDGPPLERSVASDGRPGGALLVQLDEALRSAGVSPADLTAIGAGIGPGSFTGLRVGLAAAKTLAYALGIPLLALATDQALRAALATDLGRPADDVAIVLPAGARDHYLALPGEPVVLVAPDRRLADLLAGRPVVAVDVRSDVLAGCVGIADDPVSDGARALAGLAAAHLALLETGLARGERVDPAELVPAYVAPPRGLAAAPGLRWSPDLR